MLSPIEKKELQNKIQKKFESIFNSSHFRENLGLNTKADKSPVTEIDLFISQEIKQLLKENSSLKNYHFFSEEDQECFKYPCAILDPIDGTRELVRGYPEIALSLALMTSSHEGWAWIYNPFTGFSLSSDDPFTLAPNSAPDLQIGLTSRSEWEKGLYPQAQKGLFQIVPRGSIAFKLGLLASGACDFVITKRGKNIWDIAAGTLLCEKRGFHLYQNGKRIEELTESRYDGPLYWCREKDQFAILDLLS